LTEKKNCDFIIDFTRYFLLHFSLLKKTKRFIMNTLIFNQNNPSHR